MDHKPNKRDTPRFNLLCSPRGLIHVPILVLYTQQGPSQHNFDGSNPLLNRIIDISETISWIF